MNLFKTLIFCLMFVGITATVKSQTQEDCERFKTGKFEMKTSTLGTIYITRNNNYQIEKTEDGKPSKFTVEWTSPCEYVLVPVKLDGKKVAEKDKKRLHVQITGIIGNTYHYRAKMEGEKEIHEEEITKVK